MKTNKFPIKKYFVLMEFYEERKMLSLCLKKINHSHNLEIKIFFFQTAFDETTTAHLLRS